jgi:hypothetical protein
VLRTVFVYAHGHALAEVAVKVSVPECIPAVVGLPRNHSAEPGKAGAAVIIGIHERATPRT